MARRVATIDIGTNSVLLLIAEATPEGPQALLERATITRLGEGVDRTRELAPEARARTLQCLVEYAEDMARFGVDDCAAVGTSALRDARGGATFTRDLLGVLGVAPQVIDGEREAALTFRGALSGLPTTGAVSVFDVGGGSTEIVHGTREDGIARVERAVSLDIGSVRLFERHVHTDPPSASQLAAMDADIDAALALAPHATLDSRTLVGVAGTVTTLAALSLELLTYDSTRVHGAVLELDVVTRLAEKLGASTLAERKAWRGLDPGRADVIVAGARIVKRVMLSERVKSIVVSDRGVRWGLAEEQLAHDPN